MIRPILKYGDDVLHDPAVPVDRLTPDIDRLVDDMIETMYAAPGVGLAAPQVGGFIRRELCSWPSEIRRRARLRSGKRCLRRKTACLITSLGWLSREAHLKLDLNDFHAPVAKSFRELLRSTVDR